MNWILYNIGWYLAFSFAAFGYGIMYGCCRKFALCLLSLCILTFVAITIFYMDELSDLSNWSPWYTYLGSAFGGFTSDIWFDVGKYQVIDSRDNSGDGK